MTANDVLLSDVDRELAACELMVKGLDLVYEALSRPQCEPPATVEEPYDVLNDEIAERDGGVG